ncbi:diguanylate cyclase domain-containing protein [Kineococcus rubinsiae]|uniref:diguanylate cyclase domain-containing protein n=1 Tax=Kineococcus rubinsiae TaxID=2609562 RepID=UPI0014305F20|nr:diguanylate cyclase [Kineococcus rubinsiae]NIZ90506.1 diguanylate cyclase [Kineococcus rubinsiae]
MTAAPSRPLVVVPGEPAWLAGSPWLRSAVYALLFSAATLLGRSAQVGGAHLAVFWPASALGVLWIAGSPRRRVLGADLVLVVGLTLALRVLTGMPPVAAAPLAVAAAVQALACCWAYRRGRPEGFRLRTPADLRLLAITSVTGALVSLPVAGAGFAHVGDVPLPFALAQWSLRTSVSTFVVLAVVVRALVRRSDDVAPGGIGSGERLLMTATLISAYAVTFFVVRDVSLAFALMPLGVWVALRRSTAAATVHVALAATVVVISVWAGHGPWSRLTPDLQAMSAEAFIGALGVVTLVLALHRDEGREHADRAARAAAEVARAHDLLATDLAARLAAEADLADSERLFRVAFDLAPVGMAMVGLEGADARRLLRVNEAMARFTGRAEAELLARTLHSLAPAGDEQDARAAFDDLVGDRAQPRRSVSTFEHADGRVLQAEVSATVLHPQGREPYLFCLVEDVTARRAAELDLQHRALHDALTGLANRRLFVERLEEAVADCAAGEAVGVVYLDLDGFKAVNDSLGHAAGDELLRRVADLLVHAVRPGDTVARLGGDEFAVVCGQAATAADVAGIAARLLQAVAVPVALEGGEARVGASIGVALSGTAPGGTGTGGTAAGGTGTVAERLLRAADAAMYEAKRGGKGRVVVRDGVDDLVTTPGG